MIDVVFEDLPASSISLPADHVRITMCQPYLPDAAFGPEEPYRLVEDVRPGQLDAIRSTLDTVSKDAERSFISHFTVFPEYSIPSGEGVALVDKSLRSDAWPSSTVVIGGIDGLTKDQYASLVGEENTRVDMARNGPDKVRANQWVNCAIVWMKYADGQVYRWIQPKLSPAWEERDVYCDQLFQGRSIFLFRGIRSDDSSFALCTLVCYDWIAEEGSLTAYERVLRHAHQEAGVHSHSPLTWVFVIQRNPKPSHSSFLQSTLDFFDQSKYPKADRLGACVIFANSAGNARPGRCGEFGTSALVHSRKGYFSDLSCPSTYSNDSAKFRDGSEALAGSACHDVVFRERGACVHVFEQINPRSLAVAAGGRSPAIRADSVHPIVGDQEPRAPSGPVAAAIKWMHDTLDGLPEDLAGYNEDLAERLCESRAVIVAGLRVLTARDCTVAMELGVPNASSNADAWTKVESEALEHIVDSLAILGMQAKVTEIGRRSAHALVDHGGTEVEILAVVGESHDACREHANKAQTDGRGPPVVLVSKDRRNSRWNAAFGSILEPRTTCDFSRNDRITDPPGVAAQIGFQDLFSIYQGASAAEEIMDGVCKQLG